MTRMTTPAEMVRLTVLAAVALSIASCAAPSVSLSIGFPSLEAFLVTNTLDVQIVPLTDNRDRCATLLGSAIQGTDVHPSMSVPGLTACHVRSGVDLPDPGDGVHAFIVLGRATNGVVLGGCTVAEAYAGAPPIQVDLFPTTTDNYMMAVTAAHLVPGTTADQHCAGSTP